MPVFHLDVEDLQPIIDIIEDGFFNKPEPSGVAHYDLDSAIYSAHAYGEAIEELADPDVIMDAWDFRRLVEQLIEGYHALWERPFPNGLEEGQYLFSAMMEKPLKVLLKNLKSILKNQDYDDSKPLIYVDAEREADAFNHWLEQKRRNPNFLHKSMDWSLVIAAGLFGYWLGHR